jgi:hypothetical protein
MAATHPERPNLFPPLVVPRAENESIFLQLVVQAAIRAHRDDHSKGYEMKTGTGNDDGVKRFRSLYM